MLKKRLTIIALIAVATITIAEVYLRIAHYEVLKIRQYPQIYQPDSLLGYRYIRNVKGKICIPSICKEFQLNNQGFYGPDFSTNKEEGIFRIILVGASATGGIWLDGNENYSMKLQALFDKNGYENIEVINCAIDGSFRDIPNINMIKSTILEYKPDLILLNAYFSLSFYHGQAARECYKGYLMKYAQGSESARLFCVNAIEDLDNNKILTSLYDISYIFRAIFRSGIIENDKLEKIINLYKYNEIEALDMIRYQYPVSKSAGMLLDLNTSLKEKEISFYLLHYQEDPVFNRVIEAYRIPNIQLGLEFDASFRHEFDGHPNEKAHDAIAKALFTHLILQNLVPKEE